MISGGFVVADGICVHGEHALAQEGLVLVGDVDLCQLSLQVLLEASFVGGGVVGT